MSLELHILELRNLRQKFKTEMQPALCKISHSCLFCNTWMPLPLYFCTTQRVRKQWAGGEGPDFSPNNEIVKCDSLLCWQDPGWR